jgi:tetratricopeptide (TPR) repeat protein
MANLHIYDESPEKQALADSFIEKALKLSANKDEACFQVAKTIYSYMISMNGKETFSTWTYDRALEIIRQSIQKTGEPLHIQLEGDILFAQRKYDEAFLSYEKVNNSPLASAATYFSAAKTKQLMEGSDVNEVLALMDTAIEKLRKSYLDDAAPYFFERAELRAQAGKFKEAVLDYNTFYNAVAGKVSALFYFKREQAEVQCRMYQQALDDINKAVEMEPQDLDFLIEKGAFHLRVNQLDEAIDVLNKVISINGKYAAAYRMLGYCQALQKKNKEACKNFAIAKELGDEVVDTLIEKYCK